MVFTIEQDLNILLKLSFGRGRIASPISFLFYIIPA